MLIALSVCLLVGVFAGLSAGLFGVGGGLVIVPSLVFCFTALDFSPQYVMQLAVGTSLATIVVTAISSARAHHRLGNVDWRLCAWLALGLVVGVYLGALTAGNTPGRWLQLAFGVFTIAVAVQMGLGLRPRARRELPGHPGLIGAGGVIGYVSALFGIGGGSLTVPYLSWCNVAMARAVATSAACGLPIALVGTLSNIAVGWQRPGLPEYSTGFVYWPAFFAIISTSAVAARGGARLAQRMPAAQLKRWFALLLMVVGVQFIVRNL